MTTTIQNKEKYIEKDGELYDFAGWRIDRKAKKDEWPHFLPMDLARYNHLSETWKLEDMEAKPFGTLANKALKEKNYTLAVELFQKQRNEVWAVAAGSSRSQKTNTKAINIRNLLSSCFCSQTL